MMQQLQALSQETSAELFNSAVPQNSVLQNSGVLNNAEVFGKLVNEYTRSYMIGTPLYALNQEYEKAIEQNRSDIAIFLSEFEVKMRIEYEHSDCRDTALSNLRTKFLKLAVDMVCYQATHHGYITLKYWVENGFLDMTKTLIVKSKRFGSKPMTLLNCAIRSCKEPTVRQYVRNDTAILEIVELLIHHTRKVDALKLKCCASRYYSDETSRAISKMLFEAGVPIRKLHYPFWPDPKEGEIVEIDDASSPANYSASFHTRGLQTMRSPKTSTDEHELKYGLDRFYIRDTWGRHPYKPSRVFRRVFRRVYQPPPSLMQQCKRVICATEATIQNDNNNNNNNNNIQKVLLPLELYEFIKNNTDTYVSKYRLLEVETEEKTT
jgi:hypothetical protein